MDYFIFCRRLQINREEWKLFLEQSLDHIGIGNYELILNLTRRKS